jgi:hypothetical protein
MTSYEGKYDKFKISLSLGSDKLYISALDEVTYDFYDLDITNMIFNNDNIKLKQLFNIIKEGLDKSDNSVKINIELANKCVKLRVTFENEYFSLNQIFELAKQLTEATSTKELKKELFELKKSYSELKQIVGELDVSIDIINTKNTKKDSIISIINITIDEDQVEKNYKWFLDYLKTIIRKNPLPSGVYEQITIPNNTIEGKTPQGNLEWDYLVLGHNHTANQVFQQWCPDRNLYIYLKRRNINIWRDHAGNIYLAYVV